ncbi:hypothetical protein HF325_005180 [Metschnikowia pulcherrima]|uniref:Phosphoinositide phospholipase C n=1 Tax=Metschnikowia pulcherrima TaxID=27326 RepID=A0A8H7L850_9ASCO|nr:hypothetical protein HF325_005180 [Metschnikowia pulcherrima]
MNEIGRLSLSGIGRTMIPARGSPPRPPIHENRSDSVSKNTDTKLEIGIDPDLKLNEKNPSLSEFSATQTVELELTETIQHMDTFEVPLVFVTQGLLLLKVSHKSKKKIRFWVDSANFKFVYKQTTKNTPHSFYVDDIRSITPRALASHYREELGISKEFEKRWLSIAYFDHRKNKTKNLHLIADTSHDAKRLLYTVGKFKKIKDQLANDFLVDLKDLDEVKRSILSGKAASNSKNQKQVLTFADVLKYCKRLSINVNPERIQGLFSSVSLSKDKIDFEDFKRFVMLLTRRTDIGQVWKKMAGNSPYISVNEFLDFMNKTQKEMLDADTIAKIFKKYALEHGMAEDQFGAFLKSRHCAPSREVFTASDYYTHPLNEYFILSSHNTYLTGRQVAGDSSVEGYVKALQRGCRCLEIDVWNNPEGGEPIVNHGRTFTNGISLSNVFTTIKKFAFHTTHFPLILSLEVHCSTKGQILMAQILKDVFGAALVVEPINSENRLPSPNDLKNRVLLKVKKTSEMCFDENGLVLTSSTQTSFSESTESSLGLFKIRRKSGSKVSEALSELGVYCQGLKFLYPSKIRLMLSNFMPLIYWEHGVQMVATNWQTYDLGQQLNEAFFDVTQGRGYILKPESLRVPPLKGSKLPKRDITIEFDMEVVSAQQLPKSPVSDVINPFVTVEILGARSIEWAAELNTGATGVVAENGFNPIWNLVFKGTLYADSELVFVRFHNPHVSREKRDRVAKRSMSTGRKPS